MDGHVHIYERDWVTVVLDAANANFRRAARTAGKEPGYGLLLLADPRSLPAFDWLGELPAKNSGSGPRPGGWSVATRPDEYTIHLVSEAGVPIAVISGRQIISSENLEVLVFPRSVGGQEFDDARSLVCRALAANGLAILPWGVGKWLGSRGRLIREILDSGPGRRLTVSDNGGRPAIWRHVGLLRQARTQGIANIAGSDPFPVRGEIERIGSYGVHLPAAVDSSWTSEQFLDLLCNEALECYGKQLGIADFIAKQTALRRRSAA